jgi:hypothetical protein
MGSYEHLKVDGEPLSELEQFVLEQIEKGRIANLKEKVGEEDDKRQIRAKFLEELLTGNFDEIKVHRRGVRVSHAIIIGGLDIENAEVLYSFSIMDSNFLSGTSFRDAYFKKHLLLNRTHFIENVDFHRFKVERGIFCRGTIFEKAVNFGAVDIGRQFIAEGARFNSKEYEANFNGMKVGQSAFFGNTVFSGPVDFGSADIRGQFNAIGAQFEGQGVKNGANFNAMKVGKSAFFRNTVFSGPVDFGSADIGGQFNAVGAQFQGQGVENRANFNGMKVGQSAFFDNAVFSGLVNFVNANINRQFSANKAKFQSKDEEANFNSMKVGQSAYFDRAAFNGAVNFVNTEIGGQFNADVAKFQNKDQEANFNSMKVGQDVFFRNIVFNGPVDFGSSEIGRQFDLISAIFDSLDYNPNFDGLSVGNIVFFDGAIFKGRVSLADARVKDLMIRDLGEPIPALSLERTVVERELALARVQIDSFSASNLEVKVKSSLEQVVIRKDCDLRDSSFQVLNLHDVTWPDNPQEVLLEGLTYETVSAGEDQDDWRKLLAWVEGSRFNTQNYSQLETYLTRCGHRDRADAVFITGKREAANRLTWGKKWLTRIFWGLLTGYGRKPWQVLYVIAPLVLLGAILFSPEFGAKFMDSNDWLKQFALPTGHPWIIKFLISLDRFLPGVDLGLAKEWSPAASSVCYFAFIYWYVLKLAGWITIPIALTAIYSRVK